MEECANNCNSGYLENGMKCLGFWDGNAYEPCPFWSGEDYD